MTGENNPQTSLISQDSKLAAGVKVWNYSYIRENSQIGENTIIGSYVYIDTNVVIGKNCKIQNAAQLFDPTVIHDGVFIGPGVILTNDQYPRSINADGSIKSAKEWKKVGVEVADGASIGAGAICVAPIKIGKWALIGSGSVIINDVPDFALVVGNPGRQIGWVGKSGIKLNELEGNNFICPRTQTQYEVQNGVLSEILVE